MQSGDFNNLSAKRQSYAKRIRRSQHQLLAIKRRQQFMRLYSSFQVSQPTLSFDQVKQQILKYFKELFSNERNIRLIKYLMWYPVEAFESNRIVNFIKNVLEKTDDVETKREITNLILLFVKEKENTQSYAIISVFQLVEKPEFLPVWIYISDIENVEIKSNALTSFIKLCSQVDIQSLEKDYLCLLVEVIYKYLYKSTFDAHTCMFAIPLLSQLLKIKDEPVIYCYAVYSISVFLNEPIHIKILISNGLLSELYNQIRHRSHQSELNASLSMLSKVFESEADMVKLFFHIVGNGIDLLMDVMKNTQYLRIKKLCMFILSNVIAETEEYVFEVVNKGLVMILEKMFHQVPVDIIRNEVVEFLYTLIHSTEDQEVICTLICNNALGMICEHLEKSTNASIKEKCLEFIKRLFEHINVFGSEMRQREVGIMRQDILQYKVEALLTKEAMSKVAEIAETASAVLDGFFKNGYSQESK